jgi:DNA invertase Pin-like site-specific DNA recombinase
MSTCAAIYARTSPDCPLPADEQTARLKTIASEHGWTVGRVFTDRPTSVKGPDRRPGETALINAIRNGAIDRVLIWSIDRIGPSLQRLVEVLMMCKSADVSVWVDQQKLDTEKSDMLFDVASMMALHVRQSRRDRILRGQAAARALSIRFGRPPIPMSKVEKAKRELAAGKGVRQTARLAGISAASVSRIKCSTGLRVVTT